MNDERGTQRINTAIIHKNRTVRFNKFCMVFEYIYVICKCIRVSRRRECEEEMNRDLKWLRYEGKNDVGELG